MSKPIPFATSARLVRTAALLAALVGLSACSIFAPSVGVNEASPERVYEFLNENALNSHGLSSVTLGTLHAQGLSERWTEAPYETLEQLHRAVAADPSSAGLFALAELSYRIGRDRDDRDAHLAAAVYAWMFLLGDEAPDPPSPYDRRFRWACDLYNDALLRAFISDDGRLFEPEDAVRRLPVGTVDVQFDPSDYPLTLEEGMEFMPSDRLLVKGLSLRLRDAGLGVPFTTRFDPPGRPRVRETGTALLRVEGGLQALGSGLPARLELHSITTRSTVAFGDHKVPLESDQSASLAYALHDSDLWKLSLRGLFQGENSAQSNRMRFVHPPRRGRVPVIFVHGTASNPAYWAEMFNTLQSDPELREQTQSWFFQYTSGNPILVSAKLLRDTIRETVESIDPDGTDPLLQQVVIVGHSQGGLITRLMVTEGSVDWIRAGTGLSLEELGLTPEMDEFVRGLYEFKPVPEVKRVVFISTPHRGSFIADSWFGRMMAKLVALPGEVQDIALQFGKNERLPASLRERIPTSLDNMDPSSSLIGQISRAAIPPGVIAHSIIAIGDADPNDPEAVAESDDGVVKYASSHIDGVESEFLVEGGHSSQEEPATIREVRRILLEHLHSIAQRPD